MSKKGMVLTVVSVVVLMVTGCKKKDVVAIVNGDPILKEDFERLYSTIENYYARLVGASVEDPKFQEMMAKVRGQLLESMINEKLLLQEANRRNIKVPSQDVEAHINMLKERYGEAFTNALVQQGLTEDEYRKELAEQMIVNKLREEVTKDISVTEEEAMAYYDQHKDEFAQPEMVRVRHILVKTEEEAKKVMERVKKRGEDFEKVAKEVSIDEGSKDKGGDLGYFSRGRMVKPFEDAAFSLKKKGEIKGPVKTQFGYHIIQLVDRKEPHKMEFSEVKDRILNDLKNEKEQKKMDDLVNELRSKANIKVIME